MIEKTLGGERVGSGNKMKVRLHNFERSTHNLSQGWKSPMQVGTLYPFLVLPAMRGDKFEIDLGAAVRTTPTYGALFGSYKLQLDVYQCPVRLYTGILHNNPMNIGLKMNQVKFPRIKFTKGSNNTFKFKNNSLIKYLGVSGMAGTGSPTAYRSFNAIPVLSYYDIFKNYYANKQEEYAYIYAGGYANGAPIITSCMQTTAGQNPEYYTVNTDQNERLQRVEVTEFGDNCQITLTFEDGIDYTWLGNNLMVYIYNSGQTDEPLTSGHIGDPNIERYITTDNDGEDLYINPEFTNLFFDIKFVYRYYEGSEVGQGIVPFKLKNIDDMRMNLLSWHTMGAPYMIDQNKAYPYGAVCKYSGNIEMAGLCLKTYQSDIYNNWLDKELIEGENGIANLTRVDAQGGTFTIDALNFAEKMYDLLNRVAVAGNTYEDYQDVVWEEVSKKQIESPIYLGGLSQEIVFEEIISSAVTSEGELGQIGGRGISRHRKGGKISVKVDEASFIIGIVSITPRINYSQGNEFYMTDIESLEDFHKPNMDGIGFQDLIGERLAYFDTELTGNDKVVRHSVGKQPAWLQYMTAVDKVFGYFAAGESGAYMVLDRDYEPFATDAGIADVTTYIDPTKYNYVFADTSQTAQNFWVQIQSNITARRKMSAKLMPNV